VALFIVHFESRRLRQRKKRAAGIHKVAPSRRCAMARFPKFFAVAAALLGVAVTASSVAGTASGPPPGRNVEGVVLPNDASEPYPSARILRSEATAAAAAAAAAQRYQEEEALLRQYKGLEAEQAAQSNSLLSVQGGVAPMHIVGEQEVQPQQQPQLAQQQRQDFEPTHNRQYYSELEQIPQPGGLRPMPLDEFNADGYCGGPELIATCGFRTEPEICVPTTGGSKCIRGLCVCYGQAGCMEPLCSAHGCNASSIPCNGGRCISMRGSHWRCLHPCNTAHSIQDYGSHSTTVNYIRTSTQYCASYSGSVGYGPTIQNSPFGGSFGGAAFQPNFGGVPFQSNTGAGYGVAETWVDDLSAGLNLSSTGAFGMSVTPGQEIITVSPPAMPVQPGLAAPSAGWGHFR